MDYLIKSHSWTIVNDKHFIKQGDKSFFEFRTTGIPKNIKRFFEVEKLKHGESMMVVLSFMGVDYDAKIVIDPINRAKLIWNSDLDNAFKKEITNTDCEQLIHFNKLSNKKYSVSFEFNALAENFSFKDEQDWYIDGRKIVFTSIQHERNRKNRDKAIRLHGTACMICGFDFGKTYGEPGKDFIEVHHLKPLSEQDDPVEIDPQNDLVCVCSNCHSIIHRKKDGVYTPEEVKAMINRRQA